MLRFPRRLRRWPLLLLLLSVAATGFAALQAYRTHRSQNEVLDNVVRGYAGFSAWSYQQHVREALLLVGREMLGAVNHGEGEHTSPLVPQAADLAHYLPWNPDCFCHQTEHGPLPALLVGFELGSDTIGVGENLLSDPDRGWIVSHSEAVEHTMTIQAPHAAYGGEYDWINDTLTALVRYGAIAKTGFGWIADERADGDRYLAYTVMPTSWGDTLVYGAVYTPDAFRSILAYIFDNVELLPGVDSSGAVMAVEVKDAQGDVLFATQPETEWRLDQSRRLRDGFGDLTMRAQIIPAAAQTLVIGGAPHSRVPFLMLLLLLCAALSLVAGAQVVREARHSAARTDFVSAISHELRTPVAQIRLYMETLKLGRAEDPTTRAWALDNIDREARRLTHLTEKVLRFSRRGATPLMTGPAEAVDIRREVDQIVDEFRPLAKSKRATLVVERGATGIVLLARDALRHILFNLLDNAVKFGPAGQTITVRVSSDDATTRIAVDDEGAGIDESEAATIWEPFRRGTSRAARAAGGTGIGLTVVRDLAAQHGGSVRVERARSGGASFVVTLPTVPPGDATDAAAHA